MRKSVRLASHWPYASENVRLVPAYGSKSYNREIDKNPVVGAMVNECFVRGVC